MSEACSSCGGGGYVDTADIGDCPFCDGTGVDRGKHRGEWVWQYEPEVGQVLTWECAADCPNAEHPRREVHASWCMEGPNHEGPCRP